MTVEEAPTRSRTEACEIAGVRQLRHLTCCVARLHSQSVLALEAVASCWSARCRCGLAGLIEFDGWKSEGGQDCEFVESLECSSRGVTGKSLACEYQITLVVALNSFSRLFFDEILDTTLEIRMAVL